MAARSSPWRWLLWKEAITAARDGGPTLTVVITPSPEQQRAWDLLEQIAWTETSPRLRR
jgi:hypothetical protein